MKFFNFLKYLGLTLIILGLSNCESDTAEELSEEAFPSKFTVDIPSSISRTYTQKSVNADEYSGKEIYEHLNNFINIGQSAAKFIEEIMLGIRIYGLNKPLDFQFTSNEDYRIKQLVVLDDSEFEGQIWQHQLTISDVGNVGNEDSGKAMQVFWNTNPVEGIALLKPSNWNVSQNDSMQNTLFKLEYSEAGTYGYSEHMIVSIINWDENYSERFHMDELKMFVGKTDDIIDVFGNSTHPDAYLFLEEPKGFCWAFVASGNTTTNIAVAEVGLPTNGLDENNREVLLGTYSIENVFSQQINEWIFQKFGVYPDEATLAENLVNTHAPGFFNADGFVQGGTAPSTAYAPLVNNINLLTPYNPKKIDELRIVFK